MRRPLRGTQVNPLIYVPFYRFTSVLKWNKCFGIISNLHRTSRKSKSAIQKNELWSFLVKVAEKLRSEKEWYVHETSCKILVVFIRNNWKCSKKQKRLHIPRVSKKLASLLKFGTEHPLIELVFALSKKLMAINMWCTNLNELFKDFVKWKLLELSVFVWEDLCWIKPTWFRLARQFSKRCPQCSLSIRNLQKIFWKNWSKKLLKSPILQHFMRFRLMIFLLMKLSNTKFKVSLILWETLIIWNLNRKLLCRTLLWTLS